MRDDSSIIINRRRKKRHRVQDEADISMCSGETNKLFYDLRSYSDSKFSEARKENERLAKKIKTDSHKIKYRETDSNLISMIPSLHSYIQLPAILKII